MVAPLRRKSFLIFALVFSLLAALGVIIARAWLREGGGPDQMFEDFILSLAIIGCILLVLAGYVWDRGLHVRLKALMEEARTRGEDREAAPSDAGDTDEVIGLARRIERMAQSLQKVEASYRGIVEDLTDLICRYRPDGRLTFVNTAYALFFGKGRNELVGQIFPPHASGLPPRGQDDSVPAVAAFEQEMVNARGGRLWISWTNRAIADVDGEVLEYQAVGHDVTARRETEDALRRAKEAAEAADRTKSEFLAIISHEIQTPINGVIGFCRLLQETTLTREQKECVDMIRSCGGTLEALVNDILDLSQIEAGRLSLQSAPFALHKCFEEVVTLFAPPARQADLALDLHIAPNVPGIVTGDEQRLRQILNNLVGNAVKFTNRGGVALRVSCVKGEPVTGTPRRQLALKVTVRDTGIGIDPEKLSSLFRPFSQIDTSPRRRHGGAGLGLAISKRLCEMMGGAIEVESYPGTGSIFSFSVRVEYEKGDSTSPMIPVLAPRPVPVP
jgi:PAS domain S-box-containing protein